jgi:hypothetical protein
MNIVPLHKIPSKIEAERILRELAAKGMVSLSKHARDRMAERKVNFQQVLACLAKGKITENPVLANKGGSEGGYEITVEKSTAGEYLRVGICLRFSQTAKVITVIKIK